MDSHKRNPGLDIARSIAILLVTYCHVDTTVKFVIGNREPLFINAVFGWLGVELFFILSGFLIGQILIKEFIINKTNRLWHFYIRRWFRTLPLYYLLLIFNIFYLYPKGDYSEAAWPYFLFLQNFQHSFHFMFESWSLSIEEWFYLLFPLMIILLARLKKDFEHRHFFVFLVSFVCSLTLMRVINVFVFEPSFKTAYTFVPLRLDSLVLGVLLAYLYKFRNNFYRLLTRKSFFIIAILILVQLTLSYSLTAINNDSFSWHNWGGVWDESFFARTVLFNFVSIAFCFIVAFLQDLKIRQIPIFTHISKISYSLYLVQIPTLFIIIPFIMFGRLGLFYEIAIYICTYLILFMAASLLYKFYEKPMMDLRDHRVINKFLS